MGCFVRYPSVEKGPGSCVRQENAGLIYSKGNDQKFEPGCGVYSPRTFL